MDSNAKSASSKPGNVAAAREKIAQRLREFLRRPGVIGAGMWRRGADPGYRLTHYGAEVGEYEGVAGWWIANFSELNLMLAQAQAIDYDNEAESRAFYPPRALLIRGDQLSILCHSHGIYLVLRNSERPEVWSLSQALSETHLEA